MSKYIQEHRSNEAKNAVATPLTSLAATPSILLIQLVMGLLFWKLFESIILVQVHEEEEEEEFMVMHLEEMKDEN